MLAVTGLRTCTFGEGRSFAEGVLIVRIGDRGRMTKAIQGFLLVAAAAVLCFVPSAFADTANMTLTGAGSNAPYGVYVGPYTATINGTPTQVICDDYSHDSYIGESWTANVSSFPSLSDVRFTSGNETQNYDEAAYLANILFDVSSNKSEADALQYAIWYIFDPVDVQNAVGNRSFFSDATDVNGVAYWLNDASAQTFTAGEFSNILFYTPASGGNPQEFIVRTPEPGTVLLLGLGLVGVFLFKRRLHLSTPS